MANNGKGIGPRGLGSPKSMAKYGSMAKQTIDSRSGRKRAYSIYEDIPASAYQESQATNAYDNLAKSAGHDLNKITKKMEKRASLEGYYRSKTAGAEDIYPSETGNVVGGKFGGFSSKATMIDPRSGKDMISTAMSMSAKDARDYLKTQASYTKKGRKGAPKIKPAGVSLSTKISTEGFDKDFPKNTRTNKSSTDNRKPAPKPRYLGGYRGNQTVAGKAISAVSDLFTKY